MEMEPAPLRRRSTIYQSANYEIELFDFGSRDCLFVSFAMRHSLKPAPFGIEFFGRHQLNAIVVTPRGSQWYQYSDSPAAARAIKAASNAFGRVIAYGNSMGGYGALAFSEILDPDMVIALSPAFSLDYRKVPFEHRWQDDVQSIVDGDGFVFDDMKLSERARIVISYDPLDELERRHVEMIRAVRPADGLIMPFARHGTIRILAEMRLLSPMMLDVAAQQLDLAKVRRQMREKRRSSPIYLRSLIRAVKPSRLPQAMEVLRLACSQSKKDDIDALKGNFRIGLQLGAHDIAKQEFIKLVAEPGYVATAEAIADFKRLLAVTGQDEDADLIETLTAAANRGGLVGQYAQLMMAHLHTVRGQRDQALVRLISLAAAGGFPRFVLEGVRIFEALGLADQALTFAESALRANGDDPGLIHYVANGLESAGRADDAMALYEAAHDRGVLPLLPHTFRLALLRAAKVDLTGATELFDAVTRVYPDHVVAYRAKARMLAADGQHEAACAQFRLALSKAPQDVPALDGLARALVASGRYEDALATARIAVGLEPRRAALVDIVQKEMAANDALL